MLRKILKISAYTIGSILLLLLLIFLFLQSPAGKNFVRKQAISYLTKKLHTEVSIQEVDYSLPKWLSLQGVLIKDQRQDTLINAGSLKVDMDMLKLISGNVHINKVKLDNAYINLYRTSNDSVFNYQFIEDAFTSPDTVKNPNDTSSLQLIVKRIELTNIRLNFNDTAGGTMFNATLKKLSLRPQHINLATSSFSIKKITVDSLQSHLITDTVYIASPKSTDTTVSPVFISIEDFNLKNCEFNFDNHLDSLHFDISSNNISGKLDSFNLLTERVSLNNLAIENTNSNLIFGKTKKTTTISESTDVTTSIKWMVTANNLMLKEINYKMDDNNSPRLRQGMDYAHLNIQNLSLNADYTFWTIDSTSGILKHLALQEQSGLKIIEMRSQFAYYNQGASLNNLFLQTPNTVIKDTIAIRYKSLTEVEKNIGNMLLNIHLNHSHVAVNDILLFTPQAQRKLLSPYKNQTINIAGKIYGSINNLSFNQLKIDGLNDTKLFADGQLKGLPNTDKFNYDLNIHNLYTTKKDLEPFIPKSVLQQINIPLWIQLKGAIKGTLNNYTPNLVINTADGNASIKGNVNISQGSGKEAYDIAFSTQNLNIGKIIKQDSLMGKATMAGNIKGRGFDYHTMQAQYNAQIQSLGLYGYKYQNAHLSGSLQNQIANIALNSNDPNAQLNGNFAVDLSKKSLSSKGEMDISQLDLKALNLFSDTLQLGGKIITNFTDLNADYPNGTLIWVNPKINVDTGFIAMDSITIQSHPNIEDSSQNISFNISNILQGTLQGHIPLSQIGNAILAHINKYYTLSDTITDAPLNYDMNLNASVINHPLLHKIWPELHSFKSLSMQAALSPYQFNIQGSSPSLGYGSHYINDIAINLFESNNGDTMLYNIHSEKYDNGNYISFWNPTISGFIQNDSIVTNASVSDSALQEQFALGATMYQKDTTTFIHLFKGLKFDYNIWNVDTQNIIAFGSNGYYINQFQINRLDQFISANSITPSTFSDPLEINISNFRLSNITAMMSRDTLLADGILNGSCVVNIQDTFTKTSIYATIDSLQFYGQYLGSLVTSINNQTANEYQIQAGLTENDNKVFADGSYFLEPVNGNNFNFDVNVHPITLKSIEALSFNQIKNSSGSINGAIKIKGTIDTPKIVGSLVTDSALTTISYLNLPISLPKETITFNNNKILFNDFKIYNKGGQYATLKGNVNTEDYRNYFLGLKFNADSFMVMNSTQKDNNMLYGKMWTNANIALNGYAEAPSITGDIDILDSTKVYFAMLDETPQVESSDGVVKFINSKDSTQKSNKIDSVLNRDLMLATRASSMNVNIGISKGANFNVLVDPASGSNLSVSGEAALNTVIGEDGTIGLTGIYTISDGYYELKYNLLTRKFIIQNGSAITFAGDPLKATLNITAAYNTKVAPYELVQQQITDPSQLVYYRQRLPFDVLIKLNGEMMQPLTTFDIVLPEDKAGSVSSDVSNMVQAKLTNIRNNPSDINKQAFAMLILGRFIGDDPFSSGINAEYYARQSAARLLSQQLNQIADKLVKGLDLSLDLSSDEDYSTGQKVNRTDLSISASKRLFDDRLTLTIGNDFQLEGQAVQNNQSSYIPGTLSADYRLTKDGRYLIRAYRNSQMQNIIDGYVTEAGVSFRLSISYNKFKYLFKSRKKWLDKIGKQLEDKDKAAKKGTN